jgi:cell division transport system ATP-binding protein
MASSKKHENYDDIAMITLDHVSKSYTNDGIPALNDVSLEIEKGEFVFIVGDSGSGKSTMIKLLLRELKPSTGRIIVNNCDLAKLTQRKIPKYRRNIGCVFQDFRLLKDRNVYENVAFAQRVIEVPTKKIKKNVPAMLSLVGLPEKYKSKIRQLSGGEQQRVALARALVNNPPILLADEPTGNLDPANAALIGELLFNLVDSHKKTLILVTHDMNLASQGNVRFFLKDGLISQEEG